jgi:hypothetical protein
MQGNPDSEPNPGFGSSAGTQQGRARTEARDLARRRFKFRVLFSQLDAPHPEVEGPGSMLRKPGPAGRPCPGGFRPNNMQRMAREPRFVTARDGLHTPSSSSTSRTGLTDSEARSSVGPFIAGSFKCFLSRLVRRTEAPADTHRWDTPGESFCE